MRIGQAQQGMLGTDWLMNGCWCGVSSALREQRGGVLGQVRELSAAQALLP